MLTLSLSLSVAHYFRVSFADFSIQVILHGKRVVFLFQSFSTSLQHAVFYYTFSIVLEVFGFCPQMCSLLQNGNSSQASLCRVWHNFSVQNANFMNCIRIHIKMRGKHIMHCIQNNDTVVPC